MKIKALTLALIATAGFIAFNAFAEPDQFSRDRGIDYARACIPVAGETAQLSVTASAGTGALAAATVYSYICTVATYYEFGDAANPTADSSSNYLPKDTMIYFSTGAVTSLYLAAVDVATAGGTCYVHKCR